jgi:hypothetical protein
VPETEPVSWRSIVYGTPVTSNDGVRVGLVHEVLGSDAEDIFHGLRVALTGRRAGYRAGRLSAHGRVIVRGNGRLQREPGCRVFMTLQPECDGVGASLARARRERSLDQPLEE